MSAKLIATPYGNQTPQLLCKAMNALELQPQLVTALHDLRKELRAHVRFDVKKHYSLMVADAQAGTALHRAGAE